jgi:hypothetical protein
MASVRAMIKKSLSCRARTAARIFITISSTGMMCSTPL